MPPAVTVITKQAFVPRASTRGVLAKRPNKPMEEK
jgi:hypothetical protein